MLCPFIELKWRKARKWNSQTAKDDESLFFFFFDYWMEEWSIRGEKIPPLSLGCRLRFWFMWYSVLSFTPDPLETFKCVNKWQFWFEPVRSICFLLWEWKFLRGLWWFINTDISHLTSQTILTSSISPFRTWCHLAKFGSRIVEVTQKTQSHLRLLPLPTMFLIISII